MTHNKSLYAPVAGSWTVQHPSLLAGWGIMGIGSVASIFTAMVAMNALVFLLIPIFLVVGGYIIRQTVTHEAYILTYLRELKLYDRYQSFSPELKAKIPLTPEIIDKAGYENDTFNKLKEKVDLVEQVHKEKMAQERRLDPAMVHVLESLDDVVRQERQEIANIKYVMKDKVEIERPVATSVRQRTLRELIKDKL